MLKGRHALGARTAAALIAIPSLHCSGHGGSDPAHDDKGGTLHDGGEAAARGEGGWTPDVDGQGGGPDPATIPPWEAHIRGDVYRKLVIEVDVVRGFEPEHGVMEDVFTGFEDILDKPDGIEVVFDDELEPTGSSHAWSFAELRDLAAETMDLTLPDGVDRVHVLWLDGHDESDSGNGAVLGLAWGHRQIVMYKQTLARGCDQLLSVASPQLCRAAEVGVLTHEMGHVIGLTDNGLPMVTDHKDPEHGAHDRDPDSVMYWQYERDGLFDELLKRFQGGDESALGFDAHSLADIRAVRDR